MNKYNLRYLIWCIAAKYKDAEIYQDWLGKRYPVNFGIRIESSNSEQIHKEIKDSLVNRGFCGTQYLHGTKHVISLGCTKDLVYIYIWGKNANKTINDSY